ncbi:hypothetical protein O3P69_000895 [Scylla paramamosain]|uniref:Protein Fe65 homolog n=1 Tax=Scylla paramamosain TaxID=85552 RepID=A0AAW0UTH4_SCYPA
MVLHYDDLLNGECGRLRKVGGRATTPPITSTITGTTAPPLDHPNENGVLSFENPNYTLAGGADPRLDDALNRNSEDTLDGGLAALDSLYSELDHVCSLNRTASVRNRRHYAQLDVGSMGVDVASGPVTNLDQADHQNNSLLDNESSIMGRKQGLSYNLHKPDLIEHVTSLQQHQQDQPPTKDVDIEDKIKSSFPESPPPEGGGDSGVVTDGGSTSSSTSSQQSRQSPTHIPHMTPAHTQDLYALPLKRGTGQGGDGSEKVDPPTEDSLPAGWEKHEDNDGPYYWHIKSGTITRTPPEPSQTVAPAPLRAERRNREPDQNSGSVGGTVTRSNTSSALSELSDSRPRTAALDNAYKRRSYPARSDVTEGSGGRPIRFAVRSLGWVEIAEEDLTPERSSKAVNRCIVDLSVGRRDVLDVVGCWGDGKDLFMDLDEGSLKLVDPENLTVLNTQPIHTIRVWGVGRDNGRERDFAYVARDRVSRKHMCHVFRCDTPARTIANTLRDICKKDNDRTLTPTELEQASRHRFRGRRGKQPADSPHQPSHRKPPYSSPSPDDLNPVLPNTHGGAQESDASAVCRVAAGGAALWHGSPQHSHRQSCRSQPTSLEECVCGCCTFHCHHHQH